MVAELIFKGWLYWTACYALMLLHGTVCYAFRTNLYAVNRPNMSTGTGPLSGTVYHALRATSLNCLLCIFKQTGQTCMQQWVDLQPRWSIEQHIKAEVDREHNTHDDTDTDTKMCKISIFNIFHKNLHFTIFSNQGYFPRVSREWEFIFSIFTYLNIYIDR